MPRTVTKRVRAERRARAQERQSEYEALSVQERLNRLDARVGPNGGQRERTRLLKQLEKQHA